MKKEDIAMKKLTTILTMMLLLTGISAQAQTWSFATVSDADKTNLNADTQNWEYDATNNRWKQQATLADEALKANGTELQFAQGLTVTTTDKDQIRVDAKKGSLTMNNKNAKVKIHGAKAGQVLTVEAQSSSSSTARAMSATNIEVTGGFTQGTSKMTNTGKVVADGDIELSVEGGMYVYSIKVADEGAEPGPNPQPGNDPTDYSAGKDNSQNQVLISLTDGKTRYYNTADVSSIDFSGKKVTVNQAKGNYTFDNVVSGISFAKASEGQQGTYENADGKVKINDARGWLESAYVKFDKFEGAKSFNVYVKGGQYSEYTKIDRELVREYAGYGRADAVGLKPGEGYAMKVVPVNEAGAEMTAAANEVTGIEVKAYSRQGFAFMNGYMPGAYNADGTLKQGAKVLYVTKETAKTISTTVAGAENNPCVGLQAIIAGYEKGGDTTPIAFRFIGLVSASDIDSFGSSEEGIQVKGRKADSELNLTFEGIGDDATIRGFGFLLRNSKSVEFRNFAIMRCMDDAISMDTDNSNIWVHHMDVFYGKHGGGDHAKGDGTVDVKSDSKFVTVSYNHFWDTGKTNMFGMKSESGPNYISYDHNWFDHSDSRHPRVRTMSVHVWNNYFDNVAKYGVGATSGASVFVENNYFLKTKKPILSSLQGTDGLGSGTFSGEEGGMIKAFGNYFDRTAVHFSYYTQANPSAKGYDAYETATRDEKVPETEKTLSGNHTYNNFDTDASKMYAYDVEEAENVPALVKGYYGAGRLSHGDFKYTFKDNVGDDNADSDYDTVLGGLLDNYKSSLMGIYGDDNGSAEQGGEGGQGGGQGGEGGQTEVPEGTIVATFNGAPSHSMFNVGSSNFGDGKITYEGTYLKQGVKLNNSGTVSFTPQKNYNMTIVLATSKSGRNVKLNGTTTNVGGTENTDGKYFEMGTIAIVSGTQYTITKGDNEGMLMVIKLEPTE